MLFQTPTLSIHIGEASVICQLCKSFHSHYCSADAVSTKSNVKTAKTINSRDSLVVTHPTTNLSASCLWKGDRTGTPVFSYLWSIAEHKSERLEYYLLLPCLVDDGDSLSFCMKVRSIRTNIIYSLP